MADASGLQGLAGAADAVDDDSLIHEHKFATTFLVLPMFFPAMYSPDEL
jgi:hypothetical protein